MRQYLLLLSVLFSPWWVDGQSIEVMGTVYDSSRSSPITNKKVHIEVSGSVSYEKIVFTNAAGTYMDTLPSNVIDGMLRVSINNCHKLIALRQADLNSTGQTSFTFNFDYCPDNCHATIANVGGGPTSGNPPSGRIDLTCLADGRAPFRYNWTLNGLPDASTRQTNFHYTNTGRLDACVSLVDADNCKDSTCKKIDYGELTNIVGEVQGVVNMSDGHYTDYMLELYHQREDGTIELFADDTILGAPGRYHFRNVPVGAYYVRAEILPHRPEFPQFMPTYLGDHVLWFRSTALIINGVIQGKDFVFIEKSNVIDNRGEISGVIYNKSSAKAENIPVVLFNDQNAPVQITSTDINGKYLFDELAEGVYHVYPDYLGYTAIPADVSVESGKISDKNDFEVNNRYVQPIIETGVENLEKSEVSIYPNPFYSSLSIDNQSVEKKIEKISVYDPMFRVICSYRVSKEGEQRVLLDTESWETGTYLVQLFFQNQSTPEAHIFFKR